ncbi:hypothetical protein Droror1_Dr00028326 [Drosera rotundifolia]
MANGRGVNRIRASLSCEAKCVRPPFALTTESDPCRVFGVGSEVGPGVRLCTAEPLQASPTSAESSDFPSPLAAAGDEVEVSGRPSDDEGPRVRRLPGFWPAKSVMAGATRERREATRGGSATAAYACGRKKGKAVKRCDVRES